MQIFSIERVVTLLTPVFAALAAWLCALVANNVPGAPKLDPSTIEGIIIAAFLGTVGIVAKWLHGRQIPQVAGLKPTQSQLEYLYAEVESYLAAHAAEFKRDTGDVQLDVEKWLNDHVPAMVAPDIDAIVNAVLAKLGQRIATGDPPAVAGQTLGATPAA